MNLNNTTLIFIGASIVALLGFFVKQWFTKFISNKFDTISATQERNEKEREKDNYINMRGQQVTCDCLHHLIYSVMHGGDNMDRLEQANRDLEEYRSLLNKTITEKASKYNVRIEH